MTYIKEYWNDKSNKSNIAKSHTIEMENQFSQFINLSVKETIIYDTDFVSTKDSSINDMNIVVEDLDSVSAIIKHANKGTKIAVLNFSSYKEPGGMFLQGSKAQEECLCHESFLYNVLSQFVIEFYDWNNRHKNKALYLNRALYSPNIIFCKNNNSTACDVITCASPNKTAAQKYQNVSDTENTKALKSRIKYVLDIAKENNVDTLILGAYGCGVFGQDPTEVASIFKEYLDTTHKCFKNVVFAIPKGVRDTNLESFRKVFNR